MVHRGKPDTATTMFARSRLSMQGLLVFGNNYFEREADDNDSISQLVRDLCQAFFNVDAREFVSNFHFFVYLIHGTELLKRQSMSFDVYTGMVLISPKNNA